MKDPTISRLGMCRWCHEEIYESGKGIEPLHSNTGRRECGLAEFVSDLTPAKSDNWIGSLERNLDILEGRIGLAHATGAERVAVEVESAQQIWKAARSQLGPETDDER